MHTGNADTFATKPAMMQHKNLVCCYLAVLLILLMAAPLSAASIKSLDNLGRNLYTNEIKERSARRMESFAALQSSLDSLNTGQEISSVAQINKALSLVEQSRQLQSKAGEDLKALTGYITANRMKLEAEGLDGFLPLAELDDKTSRQYEESLRMYLAAYKALLEYSRDNILPLRVGRQPEQGQYEALYNGYVTAANKLGEVNAELFGFVADFVREHPDLAPYVKK